MHYVAADTETGALGVPSGVSARFTVGIDSLRDFRFHVNNNACVRVQIDNVRQILVSVTRVLKLHCLSLTSL